MSESLVRLGDQPNLVPTSQFPHARWPFDEFNCVQSRVFEVYDQDANLVVAAATAVGKTTVAEMALSDEIRRKGKKGLFLAPLKALSQEKIDDWTDPSHHFHDLKISICTGDYRLTAARKEELAAADLIVMSTEMLNSCSRNSGAEKNEFLKGVGCVVCDEVHLLSVPGRGDHNEAGLMKFTEVNPSARIVLLSATMPNVDEVAGWVHRLNGKPTNFIESNFRPVPLNFHFRPYEHREYANYLDNERGKIDIAMDILRENPDDKHLMFVHSKRTGLLLMDRLKACGVKAEYHYAVLDKKDRQRIETDFKENKDLKVLVATSGLAWGCNLPSRRVISVGVTRGREMVKTYDLMQIAGRAGRPRYDPAGDAYFIVPRQAFAECRKRIMTPDRIESQMKNERVLAFHLVSEVHHGGVRTRGDIHRWYARTLAAYQKKELGPAADAVVQRLLDCNAVKEDGEGLKIAPVGMISSLFYYDVFDVADLHKNFKTLFRRSQQYDDRWVAMALACTGSNRAAIANADEKEQCRRFFGTLRDDDIIQSFLKRDSTVKDLPDGVLKTAACYHMLMNGEHNAVLAPTLRNLQQDFDRMGEILTALDSMAGKWGQADWLKQLRSRIQYGVTEELVDLIRLKGVGKVKATKLFDAGLRDLKAIANPAKRHAITEVLKVSDKKAAEIQAEAANLLSA